jgi:hypothetical protein
VALIFGFAWGMASQARHGATALPQEKPAVDTIDEINDMILDYKALTAQPVSEEEKAIAAGLVAKALRKRKDRKGADEWEDKVRRHRAAAEAGKNTGPVK